MLIFQIICCAVFDDDNSINYLFFTHSATLKKIAMGKKSDIFNFMCKDDRIFLLEQR